MSINGSNASSPQSVSCGAQSITISVPTPTTNPSSGIIYNWILPSGWSGSSTSNTITATTTAGTGGNIIVQARRTDVNCTQVTYSIEVTRPVVGVPSIVTANGSPINEPFCPGQRKLFQGASLTNVTSYQWTASSNLTYLGTSVSPTFFVGGSSDGTITLSVDNACQVPQSATIPVYIGAPKILNATVNSQSLSVPNYIYNPALLSITPNNEFGTSYTWTVMNGSGSIYYNTPNSNMVSAYAYPFVQIEAATSNQCGAGETRMFYLYDISNGYYRMSSPNPANNSVNADILVMGALRKMTLVSDAQSRVVRMYNANGSNTAQVHRNNNLVSFDVTGLPRGLYYLNFSFDGNKNFTEQIVLE